MCKVYSIRHLYKKKIDIMISILTIPLTMYCIRYLKHIIHFDEANYLKILVRDSFKKLKKFKSNIAKI